MKKVALSLAGVLAAAAFAPEASAVPAFARQTGMACTACHAQHFPILNGFGRAFKAAGFTMMGAQEKVEGEHLSIPANLNFGMLIKARYQKTDGAKVAGELDGDTTNGGQWQIPDEYSMFWGGRVADTGLIKIGSMTEFNAAAGGTLGLRIPVVVDLETVKLSVIPFATDALGAFYGYSESSTGVTRGIRWAEHRKEISAHQYTGMGAGANSGIAFVAHHEMGYINVSRYSPTLFYPADLSGGIQMSSTAVTMAVTPTIADWTIVAGVQALSGNSYAQLDKGTAVGLDATFEKVVTKGMGIDAQAHGVVADLETGVYLAHSKVDKGSFVADAVLTGEKVATTVGVDVTVVPHVLSLGAAYRNAKNNNVADNAVTLTAVYDLTQNVALHANYTKYDAKQGVKTGSAAETASGKSSSLFTGMLEAAW